MDDYKDNVNLAQTCDKLIKQISNKEYFNNKNEYLDKLVFCKYATMLPIDLRKKHVNLIIKKLNIEKDFE